MSTDEILAGLSVSKPANKLIFFKGLICVSTHLLALICVSAKAYIERGENYTHPDAIRRDC